MVHKHVKVDGTACVVFECGSCHNKTKHAYFNPNDAKTHAGVHYTNKNSYCSPCYMDIDENTTWTEEQTRQWQASPPDMTTIAVLRRNCRGTLEDMRTTQLPRPPQAPPSKAPPSPPEGRPAAKKAPPPPPEGLPAKATPSTPEGPAAKATPSTPEGPAAKATPSTPEGPAAKAMPTAGPPPAPIDARVETVETSVGKVQKDFHELGATVQTVEKSVSVLDATVENVQKGVHELDATVKTVKTDVHHLDATVEKVQKDVHELDATVQTVEKSVSVLEGTVQKGFEQVCSHIDEVQKFLSSQERPFDDLQSESVLLRLQEVTESMLKKEDLEDVQQELKQIAATAAASAKTAEASHKTIKSLILKLQRRKVISMGEEDYYDAETEAIHDEATMEAIHAATRQDIGETEAIHAANTGETTDATLVAIAS